MEGNRGGSCRDGKSGYGDFSGCVGGVVTNYVLFIPDTNIAVMDNAGGVGLICPALSYGRRKRYYRRPTAYLGL